MKKSNDTIGNRTRDYSLSRALKKILVELEVHLRRILHETYQTGLLYKDSVLQVHIACLLRKDVKMEATCSSEKLV
jgi:hypothetical protein